MTETKTIENINHFYLGDCLFVLNHDIQPDSVDLIYLDPPFFTGATQTGTVDWKPGAMEVSYEDSKKFWKEKGIHVNAPQWIKDIAIKRPDFASYLCYMMDRLKACRKVLKPTGSIYLHCDYRASHYLKMIMDEIFGSDNFRNEIIWHYFMGGKSKSTFARKHASIFFYTKGENWVFNSQKYRRMLDFKPSLNDDSKDAESGHDEFGYYSIVTMDDVWDIKGVFNMSNEFTGYPTQKPVALLERIIKTSSNEGDMILDPFCGCGTALIAAQKLHRKWIGIDISPDAHIVVNDRFKQHSFTSTEVFHVRDLDTVSKLTDYDFERWVNDMYKADKPSPDRGVDGITKEGVPIQSKAWGKEVDYNIAYSFEGSAKHHPNVPKPVKKLIIVSREGFTDKARQVAYELSKEGIELQLITPKDILRDKPQ